MARRRSTRALTNDAAIRAAAVEHILRVGVDSIAFRDISNAAKLSHGAMYARFEDVEELLVDLWSHTLLPRAISLYEVVSNAVMNPSKKSVGAIMDRLRHPVPEDIVMLKVLWTSRRYVIVHEEVESFIHDYLDTSRNEISVPLQSRTLTTFSFVLLTLFANFQGQIESEDLDCFETTILETLQFPIDGVPSLVHDEPIIREMQLPKDGLREQLAYHTFLAVGRSGYSRATISRISRRADCSPGAIYKLYSSKEDLVIASVRANVQDPGIRFAALAAILDPGVLAQYLYSAANPGNNLRLDFTLEVAMASAYNERLRVAVRQRLRDIESVVPLIEGLSDEESFQLTCTMRGLIFAIMGVSFLSTVTKTTDHIDFNQFAEPLRRSLLNNLVPSWPDIKRQMQNIANSSRELSPQSR